MGSDPGKVEGRSRGTSVWALCILGAVLAASTFAAIGIYSLLSHSRSERDGLLSMTSAFMRAFSEDRGSDSAVPASYRRRALSYFNELAEQSDEQSRLTMTMPGLPGYEIKIVSDDPVVRRTIETYQESGEHKPVVDLQFADSRLIDRSIYPSVASSESCVSCHNELSDLREWKLGDTMGAFVVESDITTPAARIAGLTLLVLVVTFVSLALIARRERRRMARVVDALQAEVDAQKDRQRAEEKAQYFAFNDPLTGLANRARFKQYAEEALVKGQQITLFLIDLDDFKIVNDRHGHQAGDALLVQVATSISEVMGNSGGIAARIGGDEFAALLPHAQGRCYASEVGRLLLDRIKTPINHEGLVLTPRASIGVFEGSEAFADVENLTDIMRAADIALYSAKSSGRDTVVVYCNEIGENVRHRREINESVTDALAKGELEPFYQPLINVADGSLHGFEALVRWRRNGGLMPPADFIPILEESGKICEIDVHVLRRATATVARWNASHGAGASVSVNLSPLHFRNTDVVDHVRAALADSGLAPSLLTLEITESVLIELWDETAAILDALKQVGVNLALDDFGTGYSSLAYLRKLEVDEVKIDRSFLKDLDGSPQTAAILDGIAEIVLALDRRLVIEGIETQEHQAIASKLGAQIGQGFFLGRPVPEDEAEFFFSRANVIEPAVVQRRAG